MNKIQKTLIGAAIAVSTVVAAPLTAQATETTPSAGVAADGYLHTYYNTGFDGRCLSWSGNAPDWGRCDNQVSSLWNNGYPGAYDDVWVYGNPNYGLPRRGVHNGVKLSDLNDWRFNDSTAVLNNRISSHKWTNLGPAA